MELFTEKNQCCGCMACADICPRGAITARRDREGFVYPELRRELCVDCGQCRAVCPLSGGKPESRTRRYFAAQAKDPALRDVSTSGAMFPILAERVLEEDGAVYGAAFDGAMRVTHQRAASREELLRRGLLPRPAGPAGGAAGPFCGNALPDRGAPAVLPGGGPQSLPGGSDLLRRPLSGNLGPLRVPFGKEAPRAVDAVSFPGQENGQRRPHRQLHRRRNRVREGLPGRPVFRHVFFQPDAPAILPRLPLHHGGTRLGSDHRGFLGR